MNSELRSVVDALPGLVWTAFPNGEADFVNQRWCEFTGLTVDEAHGHGWLAAIHPDDLAGLLDGWKSIVDSGEPRELEARMRRFDGEYRWFAFRESPVFDAAGRIVKWCGINTDIEVRRRAEDELRQRARDINFRQIVDSVPGLVCTMSAAGEVELLNRRILEYFGRTPEELKHWATSDAVHPDDQPGVIAAWVNSVTTGIPYDIEHRCRRADGVYRWFQVRALPMSETEGRVTGWCILLTDIDDRKRAEDAVRASERNFDQIVNAIPALAWSARPDGSAEFFNQHYLDYVSLSAEQAQDWGWTVAVHPDDLNNLIGAWQRMMAADEPGECEGRLRRFDGEYRWFLFRTNPVRDSSGITVKWYGINTDIDDRKRTEEELRRSELFLAEGQRLSLTGSFSWRVDTDEISFSEALNRIFEFEQDAPVTLERIGSRVHPEDIPLYSENINLARSGINDIAYEIRLRMPDGSIKYLDTIAYGTRDLNGRLEIIGAIQDITERRLADDALGKARSELARVARVTSLGAFTASIAHEINQPLSGIITNAGTCLRMLAGDPPDVDGASETARRTIRDGHRASDVIARLRTLFSKGDATTESVHLNEATREVIALSGSELQRSQVILRTDLADDLPPITGDRVQLQQVILNLLLNASEAMSGIDDRPRELAIRTERDEGDRVRLTVQDVGPGLDPQGLEKIFDAFYTTKNGGMGIGLSVSRSIIESHRGQIWALPNEGPGATFSFSLPCTADGHAGDDSLSTFAGD